MRINVIPPSFLADQHLRAEYNEIHSMMLTYYNRILNSKLVKKYGFDINRIPKHYVLSKGHATFFIDKMLFVKKRFQSVVKECQKRNFKTSYTYFDISNIKFEHINDYSPTKNDCLINLERIIERINLKPHWYKFYGEPFDFISFYNLYKEYLSNDFRL